MSFSNFIRLQPKKCQCVSLNTEGYITESDNTLFNVGPWMGQPITRWIPFVRKVYHRIKKLKPGQAPLFFQNVRVKAKNFPPVCDFIFTRIVHPDGESILWFIYDNSLHFAEEQNPELKNTYS
jgi:hypothetical protein